MLVTDLNLMTMTPDKIEEFESVLNSLPDKTQGMSEIKVMKSEFMTQGIGILMLHPVDYEVFAKDNSESKAENANVSPNG